jgi:hypothetical protein
MRYLIFITLLLSCSPIKRHARIVKKFPYVHTTDSIRLIDTIKLTTNNVTTDTVVNYQSLLDTVFLNKENLKVKIYTVLDSVYIFGECDTVFLEKIIERKIPVKYYQTKNSINLTLLSWVIFLSLIIVLYAWFNQRK